MTGDELRSRIVCSPEIIHHQGHTHYSGARLQRNGGGVSDGDHG